MQGFSARDFITAKAITAKATTATIQPPSLILESKISRFHFTLLDSIVSSCQLLTHQARTISSGHIPQAVDPVKVNQAPAHKRLFETSIVGGLIPAQQLRYRCFRSACPRQHLFYVLQFLVRGVRVARGRPASRSGSHRRRAASLSPVMHNHQCPKCLNYDLRHVLRLRSYH